MTLSKCGRQSTASPDFEVEDVEVEDVEVEDINVEYIKVEYFEVEDVEVKDFEDAFWTVLQCQEWLAFAAHRL